MNLFWFCNAWQSLLHDKDWRNGMD